MNKSLELLEEIRRDEELSDKAKKRLKAAGAFALATGGSIALTYGTHRFMGGASGVSAANLLKSKNSYAPGTLGAAGVSNLKNRSLVKMAAGAAALGGGVYASIKADKISTPPKVKRILHKAPPKRTRKIVNGKSYQLIKGRWHLVK